MKILEVMITYLPNRTWWRGTFHGSWRSTSRGGCSSSNRFGLGIKKSRFHYCTFKQSLSVLLWSLYKPHLKGQLQGHAAHQECGKRSKWTLPAFAALLTRGECTLSDAPHAQDNLLKLLTALSAITGTLKNLCTFLVRVPALGAAMVESAVNKVW